jgi:hypothetical protein
MVRSSGSAQACERPEETVRLIDEKGNDEKNTERIAGKGKMPKSPSLIIVPPSFYFLGHVSVTSVLQNEVGSGRLR